MISHWITPWRAAAVNYCFKDESPHHTSHTNGVSVVGTPFSLWPTITKYGFQCYLAEREAAICTIVVRETKACPLPSSATTHLRGCRVAESLPVPRQWMRHHSAWLLQLPWGLWPDTPLGPHYVNNSIFSSNVDKNTEFLQKRLKARINIFTFFFFFLFSFFFFFFFFFLNCFWQVHAFFCQYSVLGPPEWQHHQQVQVKPSVSSADGPPPGRFCITILTGRKKKTTVALILSFRAFQIPF